MKVVSVREMKANWAEIERQVAHGETFEVINRGKPSVRIIQANPRKVLKWDDYLGTAISTKGKTGEETINYGRGGRW
jgi:antitoxin (DNA-binding transcriptional repressor) of toxin-antitoxin stability system